MSHAADNEQVAGPSSRESGRDEPFLTVRQVASRLAVSPKAVRSAIARGELPATKVCNSLRIDIADLELFIAAGRVKPQRPSQPPPQKHFSASVGPLTLLHRTDRGGDA